MNSLSAAGFSNCCSKVANLTSHCSRDRHATSSNATDNQEDIIGLVGTLETQEPLNKLALLWV